MNHVVLIPERFCLGDVISFKARRVPSIPCDRLTVCCPEAWEFLFPTASDFVHVDERLDGRGEREIVERLKKEYPEASFVRISRDYPEQKDFTVRVPDRKADWTDVLIVPRKKPSSSGHRDWTGWPLMAHDVLAAGLVIKAIGRKDMSFDCGVPLVEDLRDIAAHMVKTRFVVSTDSGLAHLANLLGVPLVVLWGSPVGVIPGQTYKQGCHGRMEAQKTGVIHHLEGVWNDPAFAVRETLKIIL